MIFEMIMLLCFGISWPFAIARTMRSKSVKGVSPIFYFALLVGYLSGITYKIFYCLNYVIIFYSINTVMVLIQLILYFYYNSKEKKNSPPDWV
jgi:hypothetical protein